MQSLDGSNGQVWCPYRASATQARGRDWLAVAAEDGGLGLPAWAASQPSLLWLHVHAGTPHVSPPHECNIAAVFMCLLQSPACLKALVQRSLLAISMFLLSC